jgi:hypothetical protein
VSALNAILQSGILWRAGAIAAPPLPAVASGFPLLDAELPGGGWPPGALAEILPAHEGIGELRLLGPALAELSAAGLTLAWIAPPYLPYAPALEAAGIDLARVLVVRARAPKDALWALEQALASNACGAVLGWARRTAYPELRRLALAAAGSRALAFLFRQPEAARETTPAALRLRLESFKGDLAVRILKRRGAPAARPVVLRPAPVVSPPAASHAVVRPLPAAIRLPA